MRFKVVSQGKDVGGKEDPVSTSHRDKRVNGYVCSICIKFDLECDAFALTPKNHQRT